VTPGLAGTFATALTPHLGRWGPARCPDPRKTPSRGLLIARGPAVTWQFRAPGTAGQRLGATEGGRGSGDKGLGVRVLVPLIQGEGQFVPRGCSGQQVAFPPQLAD
jgi:hypothetical protein